MESSRSSKVTGSPEMPASSSSISLDERLKEIHANYPALFEVISKQPGQDWKELDEISIEGLHTLNNLFKENKVLADFIKKQKRHHPTLNEVLLLNNKNHLDDLLAYMELASKLNQWHISSEDFISAMCLDKNKKNELLGLITHYAIETLLLNGKLTLNQLMNLTSVQLDTFKDQTILLLLYEELNFDTYERKPALLNVEQALKLTVEQRTYLTGTLNYLRLTLKKITVAEALEKMSSKIASQTTRNESASKKRESINLATIAIDYPDLFAAIQQSDCEELNKIKKIDLMRLDRIFEQHKNLSNWFKENKERHHPTFTELLLLETKLDTFDLYPELLSDLNYPYISSTDFIQIMDKDLDAKEKLSTLLSKKKIQTLLERGEITLNQLSGLTVDQFDTFNQGYILSLLVNSDKILTPLTVKQALTLSSEQKILLRLPSVQLAIYLGTFSAATILEQGGLPPAKETGKKNASNEEDTKTEERTAQVINGLNGYINRIQGYNGNYKHGFRFIFFKDSRAENRKANFHLAKKLKEQLENNEEIDQVFLPTNIKRQRNKPGAIRSRELKQIIKDASFGKR